MDGFTVSDGGWSLVSVLALTAGAFMLLVFALGRLRLTDWLGYILAVGAVVRAAWSLLDVSPWAAVIGVPLALGLALVWARATIKAYREKPEMVFTGFFTVGRPPERVKDWPDWSRSDKEKTSTSDE